MAEAGNKARGAAAGSKTQARRVALQAEQKQKKRPWVEVVERRHEPASVVGTMPTMAASLHGLVNSLPDANRVREHMGLGPAGDVELRSAQEDLQAHEQQREHQFDIPPDLMAMKQAMHPEAWDRVLEERALMLVREEEEDRRTGPGSAFQRGYQEAQWAGAEGRAQVMRGELGAIGSGQAIKQRAEPADPIGWAEPLVQETGVWLELQNLRCQVLKAHQGAEALADRLAGALVTVTEPTKQPVPAPVPPSRLSAEVQALAVSVVQVQDLLDGLLARLDL